MAPFGSSRATIAALVERGVPVYACPGCLGTAGRTADDLMPGVRLADNGAFFDFTGGRILTLDRRPDPRSRKAGRPSTRPRAITA
jgi:hypothetical protein